MNIKMGECYRVRIHFHDEAPTLGCGARIVVARIGRKWVRVMDGMGRRARFTRNKFLELKPEPFPQVQS